MRRSACTFRKRAKASVCSFEHHIDLKISIYGFAYLSKLLGSYSFKISSSTNIYEVKIKWAWFPNDQKYCSFNHLSIMVKREDRSICSFQRMCNLSLKMSINYAHSSLILRNYFQLSMGWRNEHILSCLYKNIKKLTIHIIYIMFFQKFIAIEFSWFFKCKR